jgi:hypothetical protein
MDNDGVVGAGSLQMTFGSYSKGKIFGVFLTTSGNSNCNVLAHETRFLSRSLRGSNAC